MSYRGNESPMDFEYQNRGSGPMDPTSPFAAMANQRKRPHNVFESPLKTTVPALREPNSQPFYFSNTPAQPSLPAFRNPSFTTPRKMDFDFSSGPENSSPAEQADNEDTPDAKPLPIKFTSEAQPASKRNSLFGLYGRFAPSPGRGEIVKHKHSDGVAKRMHKKRRRAQNFDRQLVPGRRLSDDSSTESGPEPPLPSRPPQEVGWMTTIFAFIHAYPDAPSIIAKYLQVFFNAAILGGCLFVIYSSYSAIQAELNRGAEEAVQIATAEIAACTKHYIDNGCGAGYRPPALEPVCSNWQICMNRDMNAVKKASLGAHTFAEILNSFIEPISFKTMMFTAMLVLLGLIVNNATFTLFRRSQDVQLAEPYRSTSNPYMHPGQQAAAVGQFAATPGLPYGQQNLGWAGGHHGHPPRPIDYERSPSKAHRARSQSPEKRAF